MVLLGLAWPVHTIHPLLHVTHLYSLVWVVTGWGVGDKSSASRQIVMSNQEVEPAAELGLKDGKDLKVGGQCGKSSSQPEEGQQEMWHRNGELWLCDWRWRCPRRGGEGNQHPPSILQTVPRAH